jgi:hypothetical protein
MGAKGSTSANSWAREKFLTERPAPQARSPGLKVFQHCSFAAGHRDCQRIRVELDDISAVVLRAEDHDPVLARHRHFFLPQSSSASRFTAGAFGRHYGIRKKLAAGVNAPLHEKKKPRASHWPSGAELTGSGEHGYFPTRFTSQSPVSELGRQCDLIETVPGTEAAVRALP